MNTYVVSWVGLAGNVVDSDIIQAASREQAKKAGCQIYGVKPYTPKADRVLVRDATQAEIREAQQDAEIKAA